MQKVMEKKLLKWDKSICYTLHSYIGDTNFHLLQIITNFNKQTTHNLHSLR